MIDSKLEQQLPEELRLVGRFQEMKAQRAGNAPEANKDVFTADER